MVGLNAAVGFVLAVALLFPAFLRLRARQSWPATALMRVAALAGIVLMANALALTFPGGVLQRQLDLPWPLR